MLCGLKAAVLAALCCLVRSGHDTGFNSHAADPGVQQQYEWQREEMVYAYSQDSSFTLLAFTIPLRTLRAEFHVSLHEPEDDRLNRTVVLLLRRAAIPVINAFNETVPEDFLMPTDQQTHYLRSSASHNILTLASPTPGRVYLVASVLNPLSDIVDYLRWEQPMTGSCLMNVKAIYTFKTSVTPLPTDRVSRINVTAGHALTFGFTVPAFTTAYSVILSNCQSNGSNCTVTMTTSETLATQDNSSSSVDCRQQGPSCQLTVASPLAESEHFVTFSHDVQNAKDVVFDVSFEIQGCAAVAAAYSTRATAQTVSSAVYKDVIGYGDSQVSDSPPACVNLGYLGRVSVPEDIFTFGAQFGTWTVEGGAVPVIHVVVPDFNIEVRTFSLQDSVDTGGILSITAEIMDQDWKGLVWVCAMAQRVAQNGSAPRCPMGALLTLDAINRTNGYHPGYSHAYLPFPAAGPWYLAMQSECWGHSGPQACKMLPMISVSVEMTQCASNKCGQYGTCQLYDEATTVFAACECFYGYRGLACSDDTHGLTEGEQLRTVYLLTLSNLAFLPGIFLALHRRYFTLVAIFSFNCFFSTFYHACDTNRVHQLCIMHYDTLAFCDFFGSVLSFYAVLITNAKIPEDLRTCLLMSGAMVIATLQNEDRFNNVAHILPLVVAGLVMIVSWVRHKRAGRQLYPSKRHYLCFLLPGVVLALTGIGVNYGLMWHKSAYQYTHSFWHVALMISACLLIPPRRSGGPAACNKGLSVSAHDVIGIGDQEQNQRQPPCGQDDGEEPVKCDARTNNTDSDQSRLI